MFSSKIRSKFSLVKSFNKSFSFAQFQTNIYPFKEQLLNHQIYGQVDEIRKTKIFMESHIFGTWDYLTMFKSLQRALTSLNIHLLEKGTLQLPFVMNQIILNEELDDESSREYLSAIGIYQLYIKAMEEIGADTKPITYLVDSIKRENIGKTL